MIVKYNIDARKIERKFQREMKKRGYYKTVKGHVNHVMEYGKNTVVIRTQKGGTFSIARGQLRRSISFIMFKRTAIRQDMEKFNKYSSALFGMVSRIFESISKLQLLKNGLYRLSLLGLRFFSSGLERDKSVIEILKDKDVKGHFVLFNYIQILESGPSCLKQLDLYNLYSYIDSGAHTIYNRKKQKGIKQESLFSEKENEDMILHGYAEFINKNKDNERILGFFPLDVIGNPKRTRENYQKLKSLTGNANIIPVWQVSDTLEELEKLVNEEHEVIAIGGLIPFMKHGMDIVRTRLNEVFSRFPNINFHYLGGANELLREYKWFSSDSTAFLNSRKNEDQKKLYLPTGERITAPVSMDVKEIIKQNLKFLVSLEERDLTHSSLFEFDL